MRREAAVADAGVGDGDRDVGGGALVEEAGPELRLHEDDEFGLEGAEVRADGEGEVEGVVKDALGGEAFTGELVGGGGGGGDDDEVVWECCLQFGDEALGGEELAYADGVEPDDLLCRGLRRGGRKGRGRGAAGGRCGSDCW